jgi:hypothetical protein
MIPMRRVYADILTILTNLKVALETGGRDLFKIVDAGPWPVSHRIAVFRTRKSR